MYWILGDDGALGDGGLHPLHLDEDAIPFGVILHLLIFLGEVDDEVPQGSIDL
jgi:hypothetical protein